VAVAPDERTGLGQVAQELPDEQRVALGLHVHGLGQPDDRGVEGGAGCDLDELVHFGFAETLEVDPLDVAVPSQVGEDARQGMGAIEVGVPEGTNGEPAGRLDTPA
jgi:hypothetical protein